MNTCYEEVKRSFSDALATCPEPLGMNFLLVPRLQQPAISADPVSRSRPQSLLLTANFMCVNFRLADAYANRPEGLVSLHTVLVQSLGT